MALSLCWLLAIRLPAAHAYVLEDWHWPSDEPIVMDLQLGRPEHTLIDGSTSWNQVVEAALSIWNPYLESRVQFTSIEDTAVPSQGDGKNSVFFSRTIYGEDFGDDALAVTLVLYSPKAGVASEAAYSTQTRVADEADVIFNSAQTFNSYRGPLREDNAGDALYDLRRVAIHEFGNVLGLGNAFQNSDAIMAPVISDIDTVQPDDIAGVESIYGAPPPATPVITSGLSVDALTGQPFGYQIVATPTPTSYQASGLPDGLSLDPNTGIISGVLATPGTYSFVISATNVTGTGSATLTVVCSLVPVITSGPEAVACLGYAFSYQITATGKPMSFGASGLPAGLTINVRTGLISGTPGAGGFFPVTLQATNPNATGSARLVINVSYDPTVTVLHVFKAGGSDGDALNTLLYGSDGNLYGTTQQGGPGGQGIFFRCSTDGVLTPLRNFDGKSNVPPTALRQARDGSFYGVAGQEYEPVSSVFKLTVDGTLTTLYTFPVVPGGSYTNASILLANDGNYYGTLFYPAAAPMAGYDGEIFKLTPDGVMTILHEFDGWDGYGSSSMVQAADGNFYGTTSAGGIGPDNSFGYGTAFRITPDGTFTSLHSFQEKEGVYPLTTLIQATDGNFYGTAAEGGQSGGGGTVFEMTPDGVVTAIHRFKKTEGTIPSGPLIQGTDGDFYGITGGDFLGAGGVANGTIFKVTPAGVLTTLHTFLQAEGIPPFLDLVSDGQGTFYGGTSSLGSTFNATIFKERPDATVPVVSGSLPTVMLAATTPEVAAGSGGAGAFTVTLSAPQSVKIIVRYKVKGSAINGTDYEPLSGTIKIKPGEKSRAISIVPQGDLGGAASKKIKLVLLPADQYTVDTATPVTMKIVSGE